MNHILRGTAAMSLALALTGCSGTDMGAAVDDVGSSITGSFNSLASGGLSSDGYLKDASDPCIAQRRSMAEHGRYFERELAAAATGAAVNTAVALLAGGNPLPVMSIGGAVGLAGGYLAALQGRGLGADGIIAHALNDVAAENREIDALLVSFRALKACRKNQGRAIQAAYDARTVDAAQAQAQMAAVRTRYDEDVAKFDQIARRISKHTETYASVYNEIAADNQVAVLEETVYRTPDLPAERARPRPQSASTGKPTGSLKASNKNAVAELQDELLTNVTKRDEAFAEIQESKADTEGLVLNLA